MSKTTLYDVRADGKAHVIIAGRFEGNDDLAPVLYPIANPPGWTAARTADGVYTVTFADQYAAFISCTVSLEATTIGDIDGWRVYTSTYTAAANPTLKIHTYTEAATPGIDSLTTGTFVNFMAVFRNTTVTP